MDSTYRQAACSSDFPQQLQWCSTWQVWWWRSFRCRWLRVGTSWLVWRSLSVFTSKKPQGWIFSRPGPTSPSRRRLNWSGWCSLSSSPVCRTRHLSISWTMESPRWLSSLHPIFGSIQCFPSSPPKEVWRLLWISLSSQFGCEVYIERRIFLFFPFWISSASMTFTLVHWRSVQWDPFWSTRCFRHHLLFLISFFAVFSSFPLLLISQWYPWSCCLSFWRMTSNDHKRKFFSQRRLQGRHFLTMLLRQGSRLCCLSTWLRISSWLWRYVCTLPWWKVQWFWFWGIICWDIRDEW